MALGRGLGELLGEVETAYGNSAKSNEGIMEIKVSLIKANPNQPRKIFDEEKLQELSESIKVHGLLQPITVVKNDKKETYTLISGERRLRAHKLANISKIKAIILDVEEFKLRELALIENIQRDDLNIIELAFSYAQLINEHNITHDELARKVFKSRSSITNTLRLLQLSPYVQKFLANNKISAGHAKVLLGLSEDQQRIICDSIIGQKLSVRQTEDLVKELKKPSQEDKKIINKTNNYDFKPLNTVMEILKKNDLKVKAEKNYFKIQIDSQEDIQKILSYFNK